MLADCYNDAYAKAKECEQILDDMANDEQVSTVYTVSARPNV